MVNISSNTGTVVISDTEFSVSKRK